MNNLAPPDFSRHSQVGPEQEVTKPKIIIKITEDAFDKAFRESKEIREDKPAWIDLYLKVGLYCHWSWKEFKETPYEVIKYINSDIDSKMKTCLEGTLVSWEHIYIMLALNKLFGKKD